MCRASNWTFWARGIDLWVSYSISSNDISTGFTKMYSMSCFVWTQYWILKIMGTWAQCWVWKSCDEFWWKMIMLWKVFWYWKIVLIHEKIINWDWKFWIILPWNDWMNNMLEQNDSVYEKMFSLENGWLPLREMLMVLMDLEHLYRISWNDFHYGMVNVLEWKKCLKNTYCFNGYSVH